MIDFMKKHLLHTALIMGICLLGTKALVAQLPKAFPKKNVKKEVGEYQLRITSDQSENDACEMCLVQARIQAIEKAFGSSVIQGNMTIVENTYDGKRADTKQFFNSIAESMVNGEWLRDIDEPSCEDFSYGGNRWVKCRVRGEVGKLSMAPAEFEVKTLDCESSICETEEFKAGESFFLQFNTPNSGYISVYLSDQEQVQRLLPYSNMSVRQENGISVKADQDYIFFSSGKNRLEISPNLVDEYELYVENDLAQHRLYVIFSKDPISKPGLTRGEMEGSTPMPAELSLEDFQKWLAKSWRANPEIQIVRKDFRVSQ